eukprot:TRINITY_DN40155_c0_g1_i1.p1 TRINITY_DN40155_c0_g1~~TRINITY_DN40155_c0_g1_i1.p1  ORF type:complete len:103 (+),score=5.96 TRINITY_DN40155_c0_g1_i1:107-415(+)
MQRWHIVDAIAHVAHHMIFLFQGENNPLLLVGIHFCKDRSGFDFSPQGFITQLHQFRSGKNPSDFQTYRLGSVQSDQLIVPSDYPQTDPFTRQVSNLSLMHI